MCKTHDRDTVLLKEVLTKIVKNDRWNPVPVLMTALPATVISPNIMTHIMTTWQLLLYAVTAYLTAIFWAASITAACYEVAFKATGASKRGQSLNFLSTLRVNNYLISKKDKIKSIMYLLPDVFYSIIYRVKIKMKKLMKSFSFSDSIF